MGGQGVEFQDAVELGSKLHGLVGMGHRARRKQVPCWLWAHQYILHEDTEVTYGHPGKAR